MTICQGLTVDPTQSLSQLAFSLGVLISPIAQNVSLLPITFSCELSLCVNFDPAPSNNYASQYPTYSSCTRLLVVRSRPFSLWGIMENRIATSCQVLHHIRETNRTKQRPRGHRPMITTPKDRALLRIMRGNMFLLVPRIRMELLRQTGRRFIVCTVPLDVW